MILSWQKNKKVERTEPGSKNPFKVTFYDGQQKWTDDYPGDGRGGRREHRKEERKQRRPSVKREKVNLDGALKKFVDGEWDAGNLGQAVRDVTVHLGREDARETIGRWLKSKGEMDGKAKEGLEIIRKNKVDTLRKKEAMSNRIDRIAKKVATDFHTQEAMEQYMKSHPKSDPANHRVVPKEYSNPGATESQHHWVAKKVEAFQGQSTYYKLRDGVSVEAYKKFEKDFEKVTGKAIKDAEKILSEVAVILKKNYPELQVRSDKPYSNNMSPLGVDILTSGKVRPIASESNMYIVLLGDENKYIDKISLKLRIGILIDGWRDKVDVDIGGCEFYAFNEKIHRIAMEQFPGLPQAEILARSVIAGLEKNGDFALKVRPEQFEDNKLTLAEVYEWVHKQKSWFEWDYDGENLNAVTREHGNTGEETAGKEDIKEAKRLEGLIEKQFGDAVKVIVEPVDEWTDITVEIIKKMKKSSDVRIDRIASRIVNRAFSGR